MASQEGHLASVASLLQAGVDPHLPDDYGALPIHLAAQKNHHEVVWILIDQSGCSPDQMNSFIVKIVIIIKLLTVFIMFIINLTIDIMEIIVIIFTYMTESPSPTVHNIISIITVVHCLLAAKHKAWGDTIDGSRPQCI